MVWRDTPSRTLPRVRELKPGRGGIARTVGRGRTLPRVRELKLPPCSMSTLGVSRTLPRVRELKHQAEAIELTEDAVAPFPGCVN